MRGIKPGMVSCIKVIIRKFRIETIQMADREEVVGAIRHMVCSRESNCLLRYHRRVNDLRSNY